MPPQKTKNTLPGGTKFVELSAKCHPLKKQAPPERSFFAEKKPGGIMPPGKLSLFFCLFFGKRFENVEKWLHFSTAAVVFKLAGNSLFENLPRLFRVDH